MAKKSKQTKANKGKPKAQALKNSPAENESNAPFDFGGLPDRDLKKNLGCG